MLSKESVNHLTKIIDEHVAMLQLDMGQGRALGVSDNHLERPVIMGHSLGGAVALDLAEHDAQLVGPVIIVDSLPFMAGASTNAMAASAKDQKMLIDWGLASDQKTVTDAMIALVSEDLRPKETKIETPVLVIGTWVGLKSYGVTEEAATSLFKEQYAGVKHLQFVMAKQARHFVMWDDPAWFNTQVDGFLTANTGEAIAER